jgi:Tol biopolymer transport system component
MKNGESEQFSSTDAAASARADFVLSSTLEDTAEPPAATPAAPAVRQSGERVGRYIIQRCIARGGMGAIYGAWDPQLGRQVALKLLPSEHASHRPFEAGMRLQREAQAIARLCAAEATTEESCVGGGPDAVAELLATPITRAGTLVGTPPYMSPEQFRSAMLDARTDQFSFCVALYQALYGELPFGKGTLAELVPRVMAGQVRLPPHKTSVPGWIMSVLLRGLRAAPEERFSSMEALLKALDPRPHGRWLRWGTVVATSAIILGVAFGYGYHASQHGHDDGVPRRVPQYRKLTSVGDVTEAAISPDGKQFAYVSNKKKLILRDIKTGKEHERFRAEFVCCLRWSPTSGRLLFYEWTLAERGRAWLLSGTNLRRVQGDNTLPWSPTVAWSPDEQHIAQVYFSRKSIFLIKLGDSTTKSLQLNGLYDGIFDIDWAPSNRLLVQTLSLSQDRSSLWTIQADEPQQLITEEKDILSPRWVGQGDEILYLRKNEDTWDLVRIKTELAGRITHSTTLLTGLDTDADFSLSRDGKRLLYKKGQIHSNLWLVSINVQGQQGIPQTTQLTSGTARKTEPSLSPDGKTVAFAAVANGAMNLFKVPVTGGPIQQLTFFNSPSLGIGSPAWSPDGKEIAFVSDNSDNGGLLRVWHVSAEGGPPRPFPHSEASSTRELTWAPGAQILYQYPGNRNFHFLDPRTGEERPLVSNEAVGWISTPRYSPDGKWVAIAWNRRHEEPSVWIISSSGRVKSRIGSAGAVTIWPLGWSSDGRWIYAADEEAKKILRLPAEGGKPESWVTLPFTQDADCTSVTTDGQRFVCAVQEGDADAWLVENFDNVPALLSTGH